MDEDDLYVHFCLEVLPWAKNRGSTGVTAWCSAHGVKKAHVSRWMNGTGGPPTDMLEALNLQIRYVLVR